MIKKKPWIANRSTLEYWLAGTSSIFLALIVVLLIALSRSSAPLEPEWGNWAEWAGVVVTSFGFVGAIITVYMQGRSVRIQEEQHEDNKRTKDAAAKASEIATAAEAKAAEIAKAQRDKEEREKWARAVDFKVAAQHTPKLRGQTHAEDGKLIMQCRATTLRGGIYTDVRLIVPPPVEGFEVRADRLHAPKLGSGHARDLEWRVSGYGRFSGDNAKALEWLRTRSAIEFTDPAGVRWRLDGYESLQELTPEDTQF